MDRMDDNIGYYDKINDSCWMQDDFGNLVPTPWNIQYFFQYPDDDHMK